MSAGWWWLGINGSGCFRRSIFIKTSEERKERAHALRHWRRFIIVTQHAIVLPYWITMTFHFAVRSSQSAALAIYVRRSLIGETSVALGNFSFDFHSEEIKWILTLVFRYEKENDRSNRTNKLTDTDFSEGDRSHFFWPNRQTILSA